MPAYECVCKECNHVFSVFLLIKRFEAKPRIKCPVCHSFRQTASRSFYGQTEGGLDEIERLKVSTERRLNGGRLGMSVRCSVSARPDTVVECTTFDLGKGGVGIFSNESLEASRVIELRCKAIWDVPKKGTAKWCRKIQPNLYRIGIALS